MVKIFIETRGTLRELNVGADTAMTGRMQLTAQSLAGLTRGTTRLADTAMTGAICCGRQRRSLSCSLSRRDLHLYLLRSTRGWAWPGKSATGRLLGDGSLSSVMWGELLGDGSLSFVFPCEITKKVALPTVHSSAIVRAGFTATLKICDCGGTWTILSPQRMR